MTRQQIGPYAMLVAYAVALVILIAGMLWIAFRTGVTSLIDCALEAE